MTISHNIIRIVHFHPLFLILIIFALITGTFTQLIILFTIVIMHELGHYVMARFYHWEISAIVLWVFGGVMKTDENMNRPLHEDVIVTIAGPLQHIFIYLLLQFFYFSSLLPVQIIDTAIQFNLLIFLFNLLPIYPLDGGKLLLYGLSAKFPFYFAHRFTLLFSMFACIVLLLLQLLFFPFTLSASLLVIFLLIENISEWKKQTFIFVRFLLHRFRNKQLNKKLKKICANDHDRLMDIFKQFIRVYNHEICVGNGTVYSEYDSLSLYFRDKKYHVTIKELGK